jgi:hypothetical protein
MAAIAKAPGNLPAPTITRENLVQEYTRILETIPLAEDGDGIGIILDALNSTDVDSFNAEDNLPSLDSLAPATIKVTDVVRRESTMQGMMPWYLILDVVNVATGEALKVQTSAAKPMAVIARIYSLGRIPAILEISRKTKATKGGMFPLQVKVLALGDSGPSSGTRKGK